MGIQFSVTCRGAQAWRGVQRKLLSDTLGLPDPEADVAARELQNALEDRRRRGRRARGGEEAEVVPNTQFSVARTANKDNSSYYSLNGRRVQYKEVAKMLREKGIDLDHNRFLILQGEVENISLMKPKALTEHDTGMLEFLEDIIGEISIKQIKTKR